MICVRTLMTNICRYAVCRCKGNVECHLYGSMAGLLKECRELSTAGEWSLVIWLHLSVRPSFLRAPCDLTIVMGPFTSRAGVDCWVNMEGLFVPCVGGGPYPQ